MEDIQLYGGALIMLVLILIVYLKLGSKSSKIELHAYQNDFLNTMASAQGYSGPGAALQSIIEIAKKNPSIKSEIFDDFHCIHCGSVSPAEWIATRKGTKTPYAIDINAEALTFLGDKNLVKVNDRHTLQEES